VGNAIGGAFHTSEGRRLSEGRGGWGGGGGGVRDRVISILKREREVSRRLGSKRNSPSGKRDGGSS